MASPAILTTTAGIPNQGKLSLSQLNLGGFVSTGSYHIEQGGSCEDSASCWTGITGDRSLTKEEALQQLGFIRDRVREGTINIPGSATLIVAVTYGDPRDPENSGIAFLNIGDSILAIRGQDNTGTMKTVQLNTPQTRSKVYGISNCVGAGYQDIPHPDNDEIASFSFAQLQRDHGIIQIDELIGMTDGVVQNAHEVTLAEVADQEDPVAALRDKTKFRQTEEFDKRMSKFSAPPTAAEIVNSIDPIRHDDDKTLFIARLIPLLFSGKHHIMLVISDGVSTSGNGAEVSNAAVSIVNAESERIAVEHGVTQFSRNGASSPSIITSADHWFPKYSTKDGPSADIPVRDLTALGFSVETLRAALEKSGIRSSIVHTGVTQGENVESIRVSKEHLLAFSQRYPTVITEQMLKNIGTTEAQILGAAAPIKAAQLPAQNLSPGTVPYAGFTFSLQNGEVTSSELLKGNLRESPSWKAITELCRRIPGNPEPQCSISGVITIPRCTMEQFSTAIDTTRQVERQ